MRHSLLLGIGVFVLLVGGLAAGLALLVRHEPGFYGRSAIDPGPARKQHSRDFKMEFSNLLNGAFNGNDWHVTFTETQLNSYFEEDFLTSGLAEKLLPEGISAPRVSIETDKLRLAFRYGDSPWSTIISIDLRVWLAAKEPNVVALELQGLHAGSLPISAQSLLEQITEIARGSGIEVTWYRHNGNPVALLRFQTDGRPSVPLQKLELRQGTITIAGRSQVRGLH
jgi:hypothetical protein